MFFEEYKIYTEKKRRKLNIHLIQKETYIFENFKNPIKILINTFRRIISTPFLRY